MANSTLKEELNKSLEGRFKRETEYEIATVLVIYWRDCKDKGYKDEAYRVGELFGKDLGYSAEYYEIPLADSELELDARINKYLRDHRQPEMLLVIHYGGHGNPDDEHGQKQESVWCA